MNALIAMNVKNFKQSLLNELYEKYKDSQQLCISGGSKRVIFGEGNPDAKLVFIGEAPGAQEDLEGRPFVGRSGKLLDKLLTLGDMKREDVFITNIVKCRPPNNRKPLPQEMVNGRDLLLKQIKIIQPNVICTLGASALEGIINAPALITKKRGKIMDFEGLVIIPTYHPAFILRNPKELETLATDIIFACKKAQECK